jgi:hypothetical protein
VFLSVVMHHVGSAQLLLFFSNIGCSVAIDTQFKRLVAEGPDKNSYYHELFLRSKPELTCMMNRLINPGKRLPE